MDTKIYLLDSNTFMTAHRDYYSFGLCPGFWDILIKYHSENRIKSIDRVKKQIMDGKFEDDLKKWTKEIVPDSFFDTTENEKVFSKFSLIADWVNSPNQFKDYAKANFLRDKADGWLVAYALAHKEEENIIIVTLETYNPNVKKEVKIPNVCKAFDIEYETTFDMLKTLGVKFIIE